MDYSHTIHLLRVHNLMVFSLFTELCNHHHNQCSPYSLQITHTHCCEDAVPRPSSGPIALSLTIALSVLLVALGALVHFRRDHEFKKGEIVQHHQEI